MKYKPWTNWEWWGYLRINFLSNGWKRSVNGPLTFRAEKRNKHARVLTVRQTPSLKKWLEKVATGYCRLHLPVNALAQNMFSFDVKRLSFRCQTFKFSRPNVKFYFSTLLKGKMILINKKGRNYQKGVPLSTICGIKWKNFPGLFFLRRWAKIRVQFQKYIWPGKLDTWNSDVWREVKRVPQGFLGNKGTREIWQWELGNKVKES